ncbi:mannosyltransferase putative-domain-containing protein [Aspergillus californicus]
MSRDDLEKFPLEKLEWRRPGKRRRQRTIALRLVLLVIGVCACYSLLDSVTRIPASDALEQPVDVADAIATADPVDLPPLENKTHSETTDALDDMDDMDDMDIKEDISLSYVSELVHDESSLAVDELPWLQADLGISLRDLFALQPDELQLQILLRPILETGELRLRELGLRTRYYNRLFQAWEKVHLVSSEDGHGLHIRDDVIQHLKRDHQVAADLNMTVSQAIHSYESFRAFISQMSMLLFPWTAPYFPDHMHLHSGFYRGGKGIVFTAGDKQAPFLLTSIPAIRQLGCYLPVEVMYLGDADLSESVRLRLEAIPGVTTRDLSQMINDSGWKLAGWAAKPFAILLSSFREVIFIDADSLFFQNPERLFLDEAYLATGALFFKDRMILPESKRKWLQDVLPKPISKKVLESRFWTGESGHMQESGVIVVDKWNHFVPLLLVTRMNGSDRDGNKAQRLVGVYDMVYGDKETFWIGWELAGDPDYAFHDGAAGIMGVLEKPKDNPSSSEAGDPKGLTPKTYTICAPQLLHLDRQGRPLWFNGWLLPNKYDTKDRQPSTFELFLQEPGEVQEPPAWQLHESNKCCLTSELKSGFTKNEADALDMIIAAGRRVGALGKK